ncbi:hypothetical protein V6256_16205, partial [Psychromonas aquatilis]
SLFANSSFPLKSIAKEIYWLQLGHYHSNFFGGGESEVDEDSFFIASEGKTNPAAQLQATLDAFNGKNLT